MFLTNKIRHMIKPKTFGKTLFYMVPVPKEEEKRQSRSNESDRNPVCRNCLHFLDKKNTDKHQCKYFQSFDIVNGSVNNYAKDCRVDEDKCGMGGKRFVYRQMRTRTTYMVNNREYKIVKYITYVYGIGLVGVFVVFYIFM